MLKYAKNSRGCTCKASNFLAEMNNYLTKSKVLPSKRSRWCIAQLRIQQSVSSECLLLSMAQQWQNVKCYNRVSFAGWLLSKLAILKQLLRADRCPSRGLQTFGEHSSTGWCLQGKLDWWNDIHGLLWSCYSAGGRDFPVQKNVLVAELRWCQDKVALMG